MIGQLPRPEATAAIILGAAEFPFAGQFESAPQFSNSAKKFRRRGWLSVA
jgi:hypothetical protein